MKTKGIFRRIRRKNGSYEVRDVTGVTLGAAPTHQGADTLLNALYRRWPIDHVTHEYADALEAGAVLDVLA